MFTHPHKSSASSSVAILAERTHLSWVQYVAWETTSAGWSLGSSIWLWHTFTNWVNARVIQHPHKVQHHNSASKIDWTGVFCNRAYLRIRRHKKWLSVMKVWKWHWGCLALYVRPQRMKWLNSQKFISKMRQTTAASFCSQTQVKLLTDTDLSIPLCLVARNEHA